MKQVTVKCIGFCGELWQRRKKRREVRQRRKPYSQVKVLGSKEIE